MTVELTPEQQDQIATSRDAVDVINPATRVRYVLITAEQYEGLLDAKERRGLARAGMASLARRLHDDGPHDDGPRDGE